MADFDKIKINGVPYNVKDTATAQAVAQVASNLAETNATVQQQGQQITRQGQQIAQQGQAIAQQGQQITQQGQQIDQNTSDIENINQEISGLETRLGAKIGNSAALPSYMYRVVRPVTETYRGQQGICVIDENTQILCNINPDQSVDTFTLVKVSNNAITQQSTVSTSGGFGHANSATYNRQTGEMVVAGNAGLCRINVNTLQVIGYEEIGTVTGVAYDPVSNKIFCRNAGNYRILNPQTYAVESSFSANEPSWLLNRLNADPWVSARQGLVAYNGLVGCVYYNPNCVIFYNQSGDVDSVYMFPIGCSDLYYIRELEDGDFLPDGNCIFASAGAFGGREHYYSLVFNVDFLNGDLVHQRTPRIDRADMPTMVPTYLYVSASATSLSPDGSSANPFRYVQEAVESVMIGMNKNIVINLVGQGNFGTMKIVGCESSVRVVGDNEHTQTINDATVERTEFADLRYLTFSANTNLYGVIEITSARAALVGCTINSAVQKSYGLSAARSIVTIESLTVESGSYSAYALDYNTSCICDLAGATNATIRIRGGCLGYTDASSVTNNTKQNSVQVAPNAPAG